MLISLPIPLFLLVLLGIPQLAGAARVYRCPQADGSVSFQQMACQQGEVLRIEVPATGWSGARPEKKQKTAATPKPRVASARPAARQGSQTDWQGKGESKACWGKRQRLEKARAKLRRGYQPAQGERLRRQRDEYEEYLRRFC